VADAINVAKHPIKVLEQIQVYKRYSSLPASDVDCYGINRPGYRAVHGSSMIARRCPIVFKESTRSRSILIRTTDGGIVSKI